MSRLPDPTQTPAGRAFLARLRSARSGAAPTPLHVSRTDAPAGDASVFRAMVGAVGGRVVDVASMDDVEAQLRTLSGRVVRGPGLPGFGPLPDPTGWRDAVAPLADVLVMRGALASAEDGAVLLHDLDQLGAGRVRAWPFLVEHLVLVVAEHDIVANIAVGVERAAMHPSTGFSVWMSGPSKTADIEQTLVLGAHGAKQLTVLLVAPSAAMSTDEGVSK